MKGVSHQQDQINDKQPNLDEYRFNDLRWIPSPDEKKRVTETPAYGDVCDNANGRDCDEKP